MYLRRIIFSLFSLVFLTLGLSKNSHAQDFAGREFWFSVPIVTPLTATEGARIVIISDYCIENGKLEFPALNYEQSFTVTKGQYTEIQLPSTVGGKPYFHRLKDKIEQKGVKVTAEYPFAIYIVTYESASVDGETVIPAHSLGRDYVIQQRGVMVQGENRATIVATQNNTKVDIETWDWATKKPESLSITLNEGETYQFTSKLENCNADYARKPYEVCSSLNGSTVKADKPISIVTSVDCSGGNECGACENMMSMQRPVKSWGTDYVTAQIMPRGSSIGSSGCYVANPNIPTGDFVDIMGEVGTKVTIKSKSGTKNYTIPDVPYANGRSTGYGYLFLEEPIAGADYGFANMQITSDKPIAVTQYPKGWQTDGNGSTDPETIQVHDRSTWKDSYLFAVLTTATTLNNDFVVIVEDVGTPLPSTTITYDGNNVSAIPGASGWTPIVGTKFKYNRVPVLLNTTTHRIESTGDYPFGLYSIGRGQAESYIISGGVGGIIDNPLCPTCPVADYNFSGNICIGNTVSFTDLSTANDPSGATKIVSWNWDYGDGTNETFTSSTNPSHLYTNPGTYTVTLSITNDDKSAGGPCTISIQKLVVVYDGPSAFAGQDHKICIGEKATLGGFPAASGDAKPFIYKWTPASSLNNAAIDHPQASPNSTTTYEFNVIDTNGCIGIDYVDVFVASKDSAYIEASGKICPGESHTFTTRIVGNTSGSFTLTLSNGSTTTNYTVTNGTAITVTPNNTTNYSITAFTGTDPDACYVFDNSKVEVQVRNPPVLTTPDNQSICEGSDAFVNLIFDSSGPFNFTVTASTGGVSSETNIAGPNYTLNLSPTVTTTYTISGLEYGDSPSCSGDGTDVSFTITVEKLKTTGDANTATICNTASPLNLNDLLLGTFSVNGNWLDDSGTGAITGNTFDPENINPGTYDVSYQFNATAVCPEVKTTHKITVNEAPTLVSVTENCDQNTLQDYKVEAFIRGGDPTSYASPDGTFSPAAGGLYRFTSNANFATKTNYTITLDDQNQCGPLVFSGYKNCGCKTNAGTVDTKDINVCQNEFAHILFNKDTVLLAGDGFYFVLHNGSPSTIGTILETSTDTIFQFTSNLSANTKYYVTPIAGKLNPDGTIDMTDDCFVFGTSVALTFHSTFNYQLLTNAIDVCTNASANIDLNITGGTPNYEIDIVDDVTGDTSTYSYTSSPINIPVDLKTYGFEISEVRDAFCTIRPQDFGTVSLRTTPAVASDSYVCNAAATQYTHTVILQDNDASTTALSPSTNGSFDVPTNTFTSVWINSGASQITDFTDQYNCGSLTVNSNFTCACISVAGTFTASGKQYACEGSSISLSFNSDEVLDANDIHYFILTSSNTDPLNNELQRNVTADFTFDPSSMVASTTYYVVSVVGSDTDGDGSVDAADPCKSFSTLIPIEFRPLPTANLSGNQNICAGQTATINVNAVGTPPFTLDYTDGTSTFTAPINGNNDSFTQTINSTTTFTAVSITDNFGCTNTISGQQVTVTTTNAPTAQITSTSDVCIGDATVLSITLTGTPNYAFTISGDQGYSQTVTNHSANTYSVTTVPNSTESYTVTSISDQLCSGVASASTLTTVHTLPSGSINSLSNICAGDNLDLNLSLTGSGPFDVIIEENGVSTTLNSINSGYIHNANYIDGVNNYQITSITDNSPASCVGNGTGKQVQVNTLPIASISGNFSACENDQVEIPINIQGNAPFIVDLLANGTTKTFSGVTTGNSNLGVLMDFGAGTHTITSPAVTDVNGCTSPTAGSANVLVNASPVITPKIINNVGCKPLAVMFYHEASGANERTCVWDFGNGIRINNCDTVYNTFTSSGNYNISLTITSMEECVNSLTIQNGVTVHKDPVANFSYSPDKPTVIKHIVDFSNQSVGGQTYAWAFGNGDSSKQLNPTVIFKDDSIAQYPVELITTSAFGCKDTIVKYLKINGEVLAYIPNAFTPDGDGKNDTFIPVLNAVRNDIDFYEYYIFNRWGELIFETKEINEGWDGKYQNEYVQNGVYIYRVIIKSVYDAEKRSYHGPVNLIR